MTGEDRGNAKDESCEAPGGGYTIFLDEERIRAFMAAGDPSSASELDHFNDVGAQLEKRIKERSGAVILALSAGEKGISRDFAVLQIAHIIAKHGRNVLIVDGDFLHSGLSGLVENVEEHGFLDLLLYGSSLKTVARTVGIEGVSVAGTGLVPRLAHDSLRHEGIREDRRVPPHEARRRHLLLDAVHGGREDQSSRQARRRHTSLLPHRRHERGRAAEEHQGARRGKGPSGRARLFLREARPGAGPGREEGSSNRPASNRRSPFRKKRPPARRSRSRFP